MKQTKQIGKVIALTVLTIVILFYLLPNVTHIEQSMEIGTAPDKIFELINSPDKWAEWYIPILDPSGVQIRFSGPPSGKDAKMQWVSKNPKMSGGTVTIRNSKNNQSVSAVVDVNDRHSSVMTFKIKPTGQDASLLTVTSRLRFAQDSLWHYLRMMFDRSEELEIIDYIENIDEAANAKYSGIRVLLQQTESFDYISITDSCSLENMSSHMQGIYEELMTFAAGSKVAITNRTIAIYHKLGKDKVVYELGMPVVENVQPAGRIRRETMQAGKNAVADYYGSYDTLEDGHNAVQQCMAQYGRKLNGYPWEMYVTGPATEPDPNKWLTRIFYPVK